jgi:hypothetical protein
MIHALKNIGIHNYPKSSSRKNAHLSPFGGNDARLMSHFRPNVFSGNEFSRFWDIRQNILDPKPGNLCATVPISAKRVFWE